MDTEQNKDVMQRLDLIIKYMKDNYDVFADDFKTLKETRELLDGLLHKNKLQADEIEFLKKENKLYKNFVRLNNGVNIFYLLVGILGFLLGFAAFLSVYK